MPQATVVENAAPPLDGFRIAGIKSLEMGDYDAAVMSFARALENGSQDSDLPELLSLAKNQQQREQERSKKTIALAAAPAPAGAPGGGLASHASTAAPEKAPVKLASASSRAKVQADKRRDDDKRRARSRSSRKVAEAPAPEPEQDEEPSPVAHVTEPVPSEEEDPALLVVTPTPGKFLIKVDGEERGMSPRRVEVSAGPHLVALFHENESVFSTRVDVKAGGTSVVRPDLRDKIKSLEPVEAKPAIAKSPAFFGEVFVQSPNLYGEIWINGVSYGYPPRVAKKIPEGKATIEIRVQGATRRKKTVDVLRDQRTSLQFR